MSSSCWRSASTPGRAGSSRSLPATTHPSLASVECTPSVISTGRSSTAPRPPRRPRPGSPARIVGPGAGRRPHRPRGRRAPARRLARPARPLVRGGALHPRRASSCSISAGASTGSSTATSRCIPTGLRHALGNTRRRPDPVPVAQQPAAAGSVGGRGATRSSSPPRTWRGWTPTRPARRSATRRSGSSATTRAPGRRSRRSRVEGSGPRPRPGRRRHRDPRLQRDLGEDDGRPDLRRRPRDDVHGRLRARRRRPGARPPVRGGVRLPRRRGRGRDRRPALHVQPGTSRSPASARSTASTTRAPNASAGSRRRRPNRRPGTPIGGSTNGAGSRRADMSDDGCVVVVGGTRGHRQGAGAVLRRHGPETVLTGREAVARRGGRCGDRWVGAWPRARPCQAQDDPRRAGVGRPRELPRDRRDPAR